MISRGPGGVTGDEEALGAGERLADGGLVDTSVGDGDGDGVATAAGLAGSDGGDWLPIQVPIPNPMTAVTPRMAARTGPWPILATVVGADTSSYLDLKYASCSGVPLMLPTILVDPSMVRTRIW